MPIRTKLIVGFLAILATSCTGVACYYYASDEAPKRDLHLRPTPRRIVQDSKNALTDLRRAQVIIQSVEFRLRSFSSSIESAIKQGFFEQRQSRKSVDAELEKYAVSETMTSLENAFGAIEQAVQRPALVLPSGSYSESLIDSRLALETHAWLALYAGDIESAMRQGFSLLELGRKLRSDSSNLWEILVAQSYSQTGGLVLRFVARHNQVSPEQLAK